MRSFLDDKLPGRTDNSGVTVHQYYAYSLSKSNSLYPDEKSELPIHFSSSSDVPFDPKEENPFQI